MKLFKMGLVLVASYGFVSCTHLKTRESIRVPVKISGFVARPGIYQLPEDSNFPSILAAAGGYERPEHDNGYTSAPSCITILRQGRKIRVPYWTGGQLNLRLIHLKKDDKLDVEIAIF